MDCLMFQGFFQQKWASGNGYVDNTSKDEPIISSKEEDAAEIPDPPNNLR